MRSGSPGSPEVLVTGVDLVPEAVLDYLVRRGCTPRRVRRDDLDETELITALRGARGYLIGGWETPTDRVFEAVPDLVAIGFVGTDFRHYVPGWRRAQELGMEVAAAPGANAVSVAEFTLLLMLSMARCPAGPGNPAPPGRTLRGRRLGTVGLGRIGYEVARIARQGFGMEVRFTAPHPNPSAEKALGIRRVAKAELLGWSDFVSLHRPGPAPGERPELGAAELAMLRPGAVVINTVHPSLVDFDALRVAVGDKQLRCAFDGEGEGPAWDAMMACGPGSIVAAPTAGYRTVDANEAAGLAAAKAVCDALDARRDS